MRTPLTTDCKRESQDTNSTKAFQSEKERIELERTNQRLSAQIQENLKIFESLDKQLKMKDQMINKNEREIEGNQKKVSMLMAKLKQMSDNMQELLSVTKNIKHAKRDHLDKFAPEILQKKYEEYTTHINLMNDVFLSSMCQGNKFKQSEEALK